MARSVEHAISQRCKERLRLQGPMYKRNGSSVGWKDRTMAAAGFAVGSRAWFDMVATMADPSSDVIR
ncbi:hypothetical protein BN1723_009807 [Verticillium longisporum]|uniref:Uncharacterized protein n=1 Tax=Verticillium longisporum TaxID=100787 RepID=A0A0G4KSX3_VERLO|nr:hypothetical protein BN1723_009807 [Verticillium longisporum]